MRAIRDCRWKTLKKLTLVLWLLLMVRPGQAAPWPHRLELSTIANSHIQTISANIVQQAYRQLGITTTIHALPAERALHFANSGLVDGEISRIDGLAPQYPNLIQLPVAINYLQASAFSFDPDIRLNDWQSLAPYRIGILRGNKFAEQGTLGLDVQAVNSPAQLLKMLSNGRLDIIITSFVASHRLYQRLKAQASPLKLVRLDSQLPRIKLYHYLHERHRHLVPALTRQLRDMEQQGTLKAMRHAYIRRHLPVLSDQLP